MEKVTVNQEQAVRAMTAKSPVVYALLNELGDVFYIGRSTCLDNRFGYHKKRYGPNIQVSRERVRQLTKNG